MCVDGSVVAQGWGWYPAGRERARGDVFPTRDIAVVIAPTIVEATMPPPAPPTDTRKVYMGSPPTRDKVLRGNQTTTSNGEEKNNGGGGGGTGGGGTGGGGNRTRRVQNREKRGLKSGRSYSEDLSKMLPAAWRDTKPSPTSGHPEVSRRLLLEEFESECKLKDIADSITRPRHRRVTTTAANIATAANSNNQEPTRDGDTQSAKQIRGDPDGCGLDLSSLRYSPSSELRVDLPAEDLLNIKKGWLMKQASEKEWNKHWFVLRGAALLYYRDPAAEDQGILDGVIDLSGVSSVTEVQVARNYGFQTMTWDDRRYVLSAVTAGIRSNWMAAIRRAAGLQEEITATTSIPAERELVTSSSSVSVVSVAPRRSLAFSSDGDDEYRTASEGGRRGSSSDWGDAPLPPSPPLNRTPISRVKERARGGSKSRGYQGGGSSSSSKRSRSSPPSSRRSTLDSVRTEDLVRACCQSDLDIGSINTPEKQPCNELDEIKKQLTGALRELSSAEEELLRLRQRKADISSLETQVEDLLKRVEEAGKQRAKDCAELDSLKKRFIDDKSHWEHDLQRAECELQAASDRCAQLCAELSAKNGDICRLEAELARGDQLIERLKSELHSVGDRLSNGIEENDALYRRIRELEGRGGNSVVVQVRDKARSVDSLSDLTNIDLDLDLQQLDKDRVVEEYEDLRTRFEKAVAEIRAMKRELRESQTAADCLELSLIHARQELQCRQSDADAQQSLMAARIQDLATKLSNAEKQIRALKQKLSKSETRDKRRSLSLKGRESFSICKELEDKLAELEKKICALDNSGITAITNGSTDTQEHDDSKQKPQLPHTSSSPETNGSSSKVSAARLRRKSLDSATSSEPMKVLIRMNSLEAKVSKAAKGIMISRSSPPANDDIPEHPVVLNVEDSVDGPEGLKVEVVNEVRKMENLLRVKLGELAKKKEALISAGEWNDENKLNLLAEKLAYESVLVGRLHDAVSDSNMADCKDANRLMSMLEVKLNGGKPNIETSFDYLTRTLSRHLMEQSRVKPRKVKERKKVAGGSFVEDLKQKKKVLDGRTEKFLEDVIEELAMVFAVETLGDDVRCSGRIQEAWSLAQEAVNQELIQAEISQVMQQCTKTYESLMDREDETRFLGLIQQRASLECWGNLAADMLNGEMEKAVSRLHEKYQANLVRLKGEKENVVGGLSEEDEEKARVLLQRFVDIVAHKSLLDTRMALLCEGDEESGPEDQETWIFDEVSFLTEVQNLYVKFCFDLHNEGEERIKEAFGDVLKEVDSLRDHVVDCVKVDASASVVGTDSLASVRSEGSDWVEVACCYCGEIKERLVQLQMCLAQGKECQRCNSLQEELDRRESKHREVLNSTHQRQQMELSELQNSLEQERQKLVCQHEQEQSALKERARKLERRLGTLDSEYTQQMDNLRAAYHKTLSTSLDRDHLQGEETVRLRYQAEIEQLRALCEKGLMGMENSHRRIIAELEEKHRQELEALRVEKEQALAEETQATLAALDAMRKAHEAEVQKEITKFKSEFLKKMQSSHDIGALHKEQEAEMEEIKQEILSLSEKYSVKCVESAALEEELRVANNQLAQAQQHILQLDSRNKQLRAHLMAEANDLAKECELTPEDKTKESPIKNHGDKAGFSCLLHFNNNNNNRLNNNGGGDNNVTTTGSASAADSAVVNALVDKLKMAAWNHYNNSRSAGNRNDSCIDPILKSKTRLEPLSLNSSELKRYSALVCGRSVLPPLRSPSPCALSGMVAERKKIFEQ
ncbi:protein outspread isoform X2 [Nilaparvata lugens]|uniref:protein outspread isoform X2 n=1 Tax=Nilaparvata lugens TaxID=108931 RepID=UPI00193E44CA|nr:protein outspread isoform X2 [Nilaparvata lugens]